MRASSARKSRRGRTPSGLVGAVEAGGSKFLCAVGHDQAAIVDQTRIETTTPEATLEQVVAFFRPHRPAVVGIAMFGPLELRPGPSWGSTLKTPKPGWDDVPVAATLAGALHTAVRIDTDVNAAVLAETRWGAAVGLDSVLYVTVGTGIGGGLLLNGRPVHGLLHPEVGHLLVPRDEDLGGPPDLFEGACRFHGRCLEGLASASALRRRLGIDPSALDANHPELERAARYLAAGLMSMVLVVSPERVVIGGGVPRRPGFLAKVQAHCARLVGGYVPRPQLGDDLARYIVSPALADPGLAGAFALALDQ